MKRTSMVFYKTFYDNIKELSHDDQVQIYNAIFEYQFYDNHIELKNPLIKSIFNLIVPQVDLNNKKFEWGHLGGRPTKKETKKVEKPNNELPIRILQYLNQKANKNFKTVENNLTRIRARLKDGFTKEDFKIVIDKKVKEWLLDKKMNTYLRPETLFGNKFESYLNQEDEKPKEVQSCFRERKAKTMTDEEIQEMEKLMEEFKEEK